MPTNSFFPLLKDTGHSCVFDFPDRALRPIPPPPNDPSGAPDGWVSPFPYNPTDDWDPTNPLDNGIPGSDITINRPAGVSYGNLIYFEVTTNNSYVSSSLSLVGGGSFGTDRLVNPGQNVYHYDPTGVPASRADVGGYGVYNAGISRFISEKLFTNIAHYNNHYGFFGDRTGGILCGYDPVVPGDTIITIKFWVYQHITTDPTVTFWDVTEDGSGSWILGHTGAVFAGIYSKTVPGPPASFTYSENIGFSYNFHYPAGNLTFFYA
jgi:hypothetical protein